MRNCASVATQKKQATFKSDDDRPSGDKRPRKKKHREPDSDKERYRIEVGHKHGVKPGNIVGAIANEAGLAGEHIGQIEIEENFSLVDLPIGMPKDIFMDLKNVRVCGERMAISRNKPSKPPAKKKGKPKSRPGGRHRRNSRTGCR